MHNVFTRKNVIIVCNHACVHIAYLWGPLKKLVSSSYSGEVGGIRVNKSHAFPYILFLLRAIMKACITIPNK